METLLTLLCCPSINITQFIGAPLYWINRDLYYAYMALTKESFGLLIVTMTKVWGPTTIRISGDASVAGQITRAADGRVEFDFPDRMVMIANHQVCRAVLSACDVCLLCTLRAEPILSTNESSNS